MMKKIISLFFFLASYAVTHDKCQSYIQKVEKDKKVLGKGGVAILYKGNVIYKTTFGYVGSTPITEETLFSIASVSKAITSLLIASMVEEKRIHFQDRFQIKTVDVRLDQILSHTTGYCFKGDAEIEKNSSEEHLLAILKNRKPTKHHDYFYSNAIFNLIKNIFELKNTSLEDELNHFKKKSGIKDLYLASACPLERLAYPEDQGGHTLPVPSCYQKTVPCSAGMVASLQGMIDVFKVAFGYKKVILRELLKKIQTPFVNTDSHIKRWPLKWPSSVFKTYYGLGWRIFKGQTTLIFHGGYLNGVSACIGYVPEQKLGFVFLASQSGLAMKQALEFWKSTF